MDYFAFNMAVCPCSFRTAQEEQQYGSHCQKCWDVIKNCRYCAICKTPVEKERLYVHITSNIPLCKKDFGADELTVFVAKYIVLLENAAKQVPP